ncbi:MAG TPA: prepilin-type N-terminal cleavage/methylation domain-containing protein [Opitutus sp.]|nr:prepilin-type N-terminal cleavage/methylation domain-containing protein [Opitutus sp.]
MHSSSRRSVESGFTLIELLTVIAIIGILAAIIIPTVGKVRATVQRTVDANNLREVAKAAMIFATDNNDRLPDPQSTTTSTMTGDKLHQWAGLLARFGALNDATLYFSKNDPLAPETIPSTVLDPTDSSKKTLDTTFASSTISVGLVGGLKMSDPATTPVAFTRGLKTDGTWDNNSANDGKSVYGEIGGYIAFLGGNVQFYKDLGADDASGKLIQTNGKPTRDLTKTVPKTGGTQRIYAAGGTIGSTAGDSPSAAD